MTRFFRSLFFSSLSEHLRSEEYDFFSGTRTELKKEVPRVERNIHSRLVHINCLWEGFVGDSLLEY